MVMLSATIVVGLSQSRSTPYGELSALHNVPKRTGSAVVATAPALQSSQQFEVAPNVIAGAGGTSSGMTNQAGVIGIDGTIGQAPNPGAPIIYTEEGTNNVAALNSVTFVGSPFRLFDPHNFSADQRTRIIFFTSNLGLMQPDASVLTVQASGANLPVENVGTLSGVPGLSGSYIIVRLPDGLPTGLLQLTITLRGLVSNVTILNISAPQQFVNQPPSVNAGPDQTITLPVNTVNLVGTATDDGLPVGGALTVSWSRVSGPASVNFSNASTAVTTATFSAAGTYVLRLSASDTEYVSSDDVTVTVNAATVSLTPEQRVAALDAVSAHFEFLINTNPDRNAVNQQLLNYIRSRPEFAEAGISEDSCVWATYTDGVELVIVNNRDLPDASTVAAAVSNSTVVSSIVEPQPQMANLPNTDQASLLSALGPGWPDPTAEIRSWLNAQGYAAFPAASTVDGLKTVGRDGVFYYTGHAGTSKGTQPYAISTTTPVTPAMDRALVDDLDPLPDTLGGELPPPRLRYMTAIDDISAGKLKAAKHYAITAQFIRHYWKPFSPNSFVYIDACRSTSVAAISFMAAIKEKNASVYAGWTNSVGGVVSVETAKFVFDRLLGANKVYPESDGFKQRPFDYQSVKQDLTHHKFGTLPLGTDPDTGAQLEFREMLNGNFRLLAPSIAQMRVDEETGELIITGIFGDDPGSSNDGKVTVNGQNIGYTVWQDNLIKCNLPVSGPGSSGDVIVSVRNHKSNVAQLTEWQGQFIYTFEENPWKQTMTYNVRFRADIREWRPQIHQAPSIPRDVTVTATTDSTGDYRCSGTTTCGPPPATVTMSGSVQLRRGPSHVPDGTFYMEGEFELALATRRLSLTFTAIKSEACSLDISIAGRPSRISFEMREMIEVELDENAKIRANSVNLHPPPVGPCDQVCNVSCANSKMEWKDIEAKHPPNPDSPR